MTKKKVIAYYDGSNFYHHCLENYGIKDINFFDISNQLLFLDKEELIKIKYFNCPINQQEDPVAYVKQQKFFANLRKTPMLQLLLGGLVKRRLKKININCPICGYQQADYLKCPKCKREIELIKCFKYTEKGLMLS